MAIDFEVVVPGAMLCILLLLAVWHDVRTRRIPNRLVFSGALMGLALNTLLPAGAGFFSEPTGALGCLSALGGTAVGLASLLPLYALGAMGAGDVKLMAMVGTFLGPQAALDTALLSLLAGGLLALAVAAWTGTLLAVLHNTYTLLMRALVRATGGAGIYIEKSAASSGKLAYAIAIMSGTALDIYLIRTHAWSLLS